MTVKEGNAVMPPIINPNNFTFDDAIWHYRLGGGEPVTVNLAPLDFGNLSVSDFDNPDGFHEGAPLKYIRFDAGDFRNTSQALIYGTVDAVYIGNNRIMVLPNIYDFDLKFESSTKGMIRDFATMLGGAYSSGGMGGTNYWIYFQGTIEIQP